MLTLSFRGQRTDCEELVFLVGFFFSCWWWCLFQFGIKTLTKRTCLKVKICPLSYCFPGMQQGKSANQISFVLFSHTDTGFIHQNYRTSHAQKPMYYRRAASSSSVACEMLFHNTSLLPSTEKTLGLD